MCICINYLKYTYVYVICILCKNQFDDRVTINKLLIVGILFLFLNKHEYPLIYVTIGVIIHSCLGIDNKNKIQNIV